MFSYTALGNAKGYIPMEEVSLFLSSPPLPTLLYRWRVTDIDTGIGIAIELLLWAKTETPNIPNCIFMYSLDQQSISKEFILKVMCKWKEIENHRTYMCRERRLEKRQYNVSLRGTLWNKISWVYNLCNSGQVIFSQFTPRFLS